MVFTKTFGRLLLLLTSLVVIVGAAYLVRQKVFDDTVEAAALAARLNSAPVAAAARYADASKRQGVLLDALRKLTIDSAEQQERIGMLRARIDDRLAAFDHA